MTLIAYHGSQAEKDTIMAQLEAHRKADDFRQGFFWKDPSEKGKNAGKGADGWGGGGGGGGGSCVTGGTAGAGGKGGDGMVIVLVY